MKELLDLIRDAALGVVLGVLGLVWTSQPSDFEHPMVILAILAVFGGLCGIGIGRFFR